MKSINEFVNKQLWRIKQTYLVFQPLINVIQFLLWIVIAVGINNWFEFTWDRFSIILIITFVGLNIIGYILDKKKFFLEHASRQFRISMPKIWHKQVMYNSMLIALNMRLDDEELKKRIEELECELSLEEE